MNHRWLRVRVGQLLFRVKKGKSASNGGSFPAQVIHIDCVPLQKIWQRALVGRRKTRHNQEMMFLFYPKFKFTPSLSLSFPPPPSLSLSRLIMPSPKFSSTSFLPIAIFCEATWLTSFSICRISIQYSKFHGPVQSAILIVITWGWYSKISQFSGDTVSIECIHVPMNFRMFRCVKYTSSHAR